MEGSCKILRVNLTTGTTRAETLDNKVQRLFLGGNGFAAFFLFREIPPKTEPLSPQNKIFIGAGPLVGTGLPFCARTYVASKSPLTGLWGDSTSGGFWSGALRRAGYDALIIEGKAEEPVNLIIDEGSASIERSEEWGLNTYETEKGIKDTLGKDFKIICVGQAGEKLVRYACLITDGRACARTGIGAVFGSKKLKAIAVRGKGEVRIAEQEKLKEYTKALRKRFPNTPLGKGYNLKGTSTLLETIGYLGLLGTENWQKEWFEKTGPLYNDLDATRGRGNPCFQCVSRCEHEYTIKEGPRKGVVGHPEYETIYALGSCCGNSDANSIILMDRMCDAYGLDTISTGLSMSFAMECMEKGILNKEDMDGLDLRFGNFEAMMEMVKEIAERKGFGNILAEGSRRASEILGKGSEKYAMQVKGLEFAGHALRATKGMALGYAISNRGGSHHDGRPFEYSAHPELGYDGKMKGIDRIGNIVARITQWTAFADCAGYCHFAEGVYGMSISEEHLKQVNLVTGFGYTLKDLYDIGARTYTLERAFNVREGVSRRDDSVSHRFFAEPIPEGPKKGAHLTEEEMTTMLDEFYKAYGWDKDGIPTKDRWRELGLSDEDFKEMLLD